MRIASASLSNGITAAQNAVSNSLNSWNLDSAKVATYTVDFATSASGPWSTNPSPATGYIYSRIQATGPVNLLFIPVVVSQYVQNVNSMAVGGQILQTGSIPLGLGPLSAIGPNPGTGKKRKRRPDRRRTYPYLPHQRNRTDH